MVNFSQLAVYRGFETEFTLERAGQHQLRKQGCDLQGHVAMLQRYTQDRTVL